MGFHKRKFCGIVIIFTLFISLLSPQWGVFAAGLISLSTIGSPYTQNFDTLAIAGTSSITPNGWYFLESGTNANSTYTAGTGSSNVGDTYSFGSSGDSDRAFGGLLSGSLVPTVGAQFVNNTGVSISSLEITYTGEQWRLGALGREDRLGFQLSTDATSLATGTWTNYSQLNFSAPVQSPTVGALNGNLPTNRTAISHTITGLNIQPGGTFWIRWTDFNAPGADDGLAVDDFSLIPLGGPPVVVSISRAGPSPTNVASVDFTVVFSKAVTGVDVTDFTLTTSGLSSAAVSGVSGSGTTYTVTAATGTGDGTLRLDVVDDDSIIDAALIPLGGPGAGNGNFSSGETYTIEKTPPELNISTTAANPTNLSPIPLTFTFTKAVSGFEISDIVVANGTAGNFSGGGSSYSVDITPAADGLVSVDVPVNSAVDSAGNGNLAAPQFTITYDGTRPTVTVEQAAGQNDPTANSPINFTATFNEEINTATLTAGDVTLGGSAGANSAVISEIAPLNGTTFNIAVSGMATSGTVTASFAAGVVQDPAGNPNLTSTSTDNTVTYDITAPVVSSIGRNNSNPTNLSSVGFTVVFSKTVIGVDVTDFALTTTGLTAAAVSSVSGAGDTYTVLVNTGTGSGTLRLDVLDDDSITDLLTNPLGGPGPGNGDFITGPAYTIDRSTQAGDGGIIVNETSNGSGGNREWVELVVVGSGATVDLSGWIIDDNNGDFDSLAPGKGIASGHLRFADPLPACPAGQSLAAAPVGARIIIYNSGDVEGPLSGLPNDPCDTDGDNVYYLPIGAASNTNHLQRCMDRPRVSPSPPSSEYSGCVYGAADNWAGMDLRNTGDVMQTRRPSGLFYHGFAYGDLTVPPAPNFSDGSLSFNISTSTGTNMAYRFSCGNYFSNSSGQFTRENSGFANPGSANSLLNAAFIRSLQLGTYDYGNLSDANNCRVEPHVMTVFSKPQVKVGEPVQLAVTLTNPYNTLDGYPLNLVGINLTNNLPAGLVLHGTNPVVNSCGGIFSGVSGSSSFSITNVGLDSDAGPGGNSCQVVVSVRAASSGSYTNNIPVGAVTSAISGVSGGSNIVPASTTLLVVDPSLSYDLPATGFKPGQITVLPPQPINKVYDQSQSIRLEIPVMGVSADIVGVPIGENGWDVTWLGNQIGWLEGSAFPTWSGNSVLTAHVYDANGLPGLFAGLHQLKWGDRIIIHAWGQRHVYEVREAEESVRPDDASVLASEDHPWLTLITCRGYDEESDTYHWRVVVRAVQVPAK